ncbi:MAG: hypothetical protein RSF33_08150 [Hydrogenoanaerobacterium sp.]
MEDNPYAKMAQPVGTVRRIIKMGVVTSKTPLKILADGLELCGSDLYVNSALLFAATGEQTLRAGDNVAMLTEDNQTYLVLCKAVRVS